MKRVWLVTMEELLNGDQIGNKWEPFRASKKVTDENHLGPPNQQQIKSYIKPPKGNKWNPF